MGISNRYTLRMARQAQTSTAVLGALSIEPMTGYEIRQAISTVLGHFWHESFGQIYPCLADLEAAGQVRSTPATDRARPATRSPLPACAASGSSSASPPSPSPRATARCCASSSGVRCPRTTSTRSWRADEEAAHARLAGYAAIRAGIAR